MLTVRNRCQLNPPTAWNPAKNGDSRNPRKRTKRNRQTANLSKKVGKSVCVHRFSGKTSPPRLPVRRRQTAGGKPSALLLQWAEGLASGRTDLAVIFDSDWPWFEQTTCEEASGGVETAGGWHCLFQRMPHLCIYDNQQVGRWVRNPEGGNPRTRWAASASVRDEIRTCHLPPSHMTGTALDLRALHVPCRIFCGPGETTSYSSQHSPTGLQQASFLLPSPFLLTGVGRCPHPSVSVECGEGAGPPEDGGHLRPATSFYSAPGVEGNGSERNGCFSGEPGLIFLTSLLLPKRGRRGLFSNALIVNGQEHVRAVLLPCIPLSSVAFSNSPATVG